MSWAKWRPHFIAIMDPRYYTESWLDGEVEAGRFTLMMAEDAAALVTVLTFPTGAKEAHGVAAVGNLKTVIGELIPRWEALSREQGCVTASIESRDGWQRALRSSGYEPYQTKIRKDL